jgi:enolase
MILLEKTFDIVVKAIDKVGCRGRIKIGIDVAASKFYDEQYDLIKRNKRSTEL